MTCWSSPAPTLAAADSVWIMLMAVVKSTE
jgi:hypothetical protein